MKKLLEFCKEHILFFVTLGLLAFIPLYPKIPLVDIRHTWVYVRVEDFVVLFTLFFWGISTIRKRTSVQTPLTVPILLFWTIGGVATIHGLLLIFISLGDVRGNVALLSMLRRIEYMSLFFVAYSAMKDKRYLSWVAIVLTGTVMAVALYGLGQKYGGFPAFLTMNEEFAKGIPIRLSGLSRVSSTFGGHYDLAAYLVLVLPILVSMMFAVKHLFGRLALGVASLLGLVVMVMTVSRISLFALVAAVGVVMFAQKKKLVLISVPIIIIGAMIFVTISPSIVQRYTSTVKQIDVLVSATTGEAVGHSTNVSNDYFVNKTVRQVYSTSVTDLYNHASPSASRDVPYAWIEKDPVLYVEPNAPNGENLPQGTGYVNLELSPIVRKLGHFYYEPIPKTATTSAEVFIINGDFLLKKVYTYDLSFTTRFQGEWPRAIETFKKNIFIGSGYGSVGLAVDNSYLRMLAEVGLLGFGTFFSIFVLAGIYIWKSLPGVHDLKTRSFIIGFVGGVGGLVINAFFIDVFEASKVAFVLWLLFGVSFGSLGLLVRKPLDLLKPFISTLLSPFAIAIYLFIVAFVLFFSITSNNFVGDDFTWLRWAADCGKSIIDSTRCNLKWSTIAEYFTQAQGFFYRPGSKIYFLLMYSVFWLNQSAYHTVSLMLHVGVAIMVFLLAWKVLRNLLLSVLSAVTFLLISGHAEPVFWVSATGFLFTSLLSLLSLMWFITWSETGKWVYFIGTIGSFALSLMFHELGIVTPLFYLLYLWCTDGWQELRRRLSTVRYAALFGPVPVYLILRYLASSHWLSGDYNYNFLKLPLNALGNSLGYAALGIFGPLSLPVVQNFRDWGRVHVLTAVGFTFLAAYGLRWVWKSYKDSIGNEDKKVWLFGIGFFLIAILPFIGLGNMTSRYSYLSSVAVAILLVFMLHKVYRYLLGSGRTVAVLSVVILGSTWSLLQLIQHQQMQRDWYDAGEESRKFIVGMDAAYNDYWRTDPMEFHLVNVPIRLGEAWVFPVGLPDALWFVFRNPDIRVFMWPTLKSAFDAVAFDSIHQRVFEFTTTGGLIERRKIRTTP
ncbi:MAG: O-antigen ligase family protein [Candidatus Gottesmanbacteria bacterium]|nr:O-antigen ligase family protein [Candidatus Gottesmanbacteria bacterium]